LLADLTEIEGQLSGARTNLRGRLRVDVPAASGRHVIGPALPEFLARYPDITIEIGSSDRPVDLILEGVDCVIRGGTVFDESLVARKLGAFEIITCAAPCYLTKNGVPKKPADLKRHHHVAVNFFSAKTARIFPLSFIEKNGSEQLIHLDHLAAANDADTHIELTCAGLGIAQLPLTQTLRVRMEQGQLTRILSDWNAGELPLYVMYPRNRHLNLRLKVFVEWVQQLYAGKF
jgi:LysR family transcriptional regulator, regulator for bpeEF and oprC